jgi:hypothetical protein
MQRCLADVVATLSSLGALGVVSCGGEPAHDVGGSTVYVLTSAAAAPSASAAPAATPSALVDAVPPDAHAIDPHAVPTLTAYKLAADDSIRVDGVMTEGAWKLASTTGALVDVGTGAPNDRSPVNATAKIAWDDRNLYIFWHVEEKDIIGGFTNPRSQPNDWTAGGQPKLWTKDCVELMLDPDGDGDNKDYYELQINPQNRVFHSQFDALQMPHGGPNGPFGHEDWNPGLRSAVAVHGTLDKPDDRDTGYDVEMALPWAALSKAHAHPPSPGDEWRVNLYGMKLNGGVAWSPILGQGNFHKASRFGRVTWATRAP